MHKTCLFYLRRSCSLSSLKQKIPSADKKKKKKSRIPEALLPKCGVDSWSPLPRCLGVEFCCAGWGWTCSHPDLGTFLNGAAAGWTERVQGPPGAGSGWSGVSGRVQRPLITSRAGWRRWGCDAFTCCRRRRFIYIYIFVHMEHQHLHNIQQI